MLYKKNGPLFPSTVNRFFQALNRPQYYPFLDGFRALAIFGVVMAHTSNFFLTHQQSHPIFWIINIIGPLGHLGVDIFFVISGFLITGILYENDEKSLDIRKFYTRRFFKICPHYYFVCAIVFVMGYFFEIPSNFNKYWPHLLFIQNYFPAFWTLAHTWSLAIEEHFYLIYPLILWFVFKFTPDIKKRRGLLILFLVLLAIATAIFRHHCSIQSSFTILYRMDGLLWGCVLRLLEPFYSKTKKLSNYFLIFCLLMAIGILVYLGTTLDRNFVIQTWDKYLLTYIATILTFFVAYFRFTPWIWIVENDTMRWIGRNSYAMYLWHLPILFLFTVHGPPTHIFLGICGYWLTLLCVSVFTTETIEKYFLTLREKIAPR